MLAIGAAIQPDFGDSSSGNNNLPMSHDDYFEESVLKKLELGEQEDLVDSEDSPYADPTTANNSSEEDDNDTAKQEKRRSRSKSSRNPSAKKTTRSSSKEKRPDRSSSPSKSTRTRSSSKNPSNTTRSKSMRKSRSVDELKNNEALSSTRRPKTKAGERTKSKTRSKSKSTRNRSSITATTTTTTESNPRAKSMRRSRSMDAMLVGEGTTQSSNRPKRRSDKATLARRNSSFSTKRGALKTTVESTPVKGLLKNTVHRISSSGGDDDHGHNERTIMDSSEVLASLYSGLYQTPKPVKVTSKKSLHRRTLSSDNDSEETSGSNRKELARRRRSREHTSPPLSGVRRSSSEGDLDLNESYRYPKSDQAEKVTESSDHKVHKKLSTRRRGSSKGDLMESDHEMQKKTPKSGRRVKKSSIQRSASDGDIGFSDGEDKPSMKNQKVKKTLGRRLTSSEALNKIKSTIRRSASNGDLDASESSNAVNKNRDLLEIAAPEPTKRAPRRSTSAIGGRSHKVGSFQILQALQQRESGWDNATRDRSARRERRGTGGNDEDEEEKARPPRRAISHGSLKGLRASSGHGTRSVEKSQRRSRTSSTVRDRMSQTRQRPRRSNPGLDTNDDPSRQLRALSNHDPRKRPSKRDSGIKASSSHGGRRGESARPRPRRQKSFDDLPDPKPLKPSSSHCDLGDHDEISPKRRASVVTGTKKDTSSHGGLVDFFDKVDVAGDLQEDSDITKGKGTDAVATSSVLSVYGFLSGTATATKPSPGETPTAATSGIFSRILSTSAAATDNNEKDSIVPPGLRRTFSGQNATLPALRRTSSSQSLNRQGQDGIAVNDESVQKDPLRSQSAHSGIMGPMDIKKQMSFRVKKSTDKGGKSTLRPKKEFSDLDDSFESHCDSGLA